MIARLTRLVVVAWLVMGLAGCEGRREHVFSGRTMGTTYQVTVVTGRIGSVDGLQPKIDRRLDEVNRSMSPYLADSEISRFNRLAEVDREFPVSRDFLTVMKAAAQIHLLSEGAWDGTVNPLVDLWGFGRAGRVDTPPPAEKIAALLADIGFGKIEIRDNGALVKRRAGVTLDLSSIAKGFGVDAVAEVVRGEGFTEFLVEIGGEVVAAGRRADGGRWRVGINRPKADARPDELYRVVALENCAFATSGDYRQFFVAGGVRYSHVIDPRSGYPVINRVVSASVVAPDCTLADGLSTAVMVMGAEKGLALIERLEGVEGLIVVEDAAGALVDHASAGFRSRP